ncbi:hypothetical protein RJ639_041966 [Escallonia herrerae]|uniref:Uncharacterized protein n=1 Tax=Escallonia herrerae TaxID=1293975 RepID=A0AA88WIJ2_9ASTE|nr:hypothetical protein RJ639_041966 [Escallonia herrerae]
MACDQELLTIFTATEPPICSSSRLGTPPPSCNRTITAATVPVDTGKPHTKGFLFLFFLTAKVFLLESFMPLVGRDSEASLVPDPFCVDSGRSRLEGVQYTSLCTWFDEAILIDFAVSLACFLAVAASLSLHKNALLCPKTMHATNFKRQRPVRQLDLCMIGGVINTQKTIEIKVGMSSLPNLTFSDVCLVNITTGGSTLLNFSTNSANISGHIPDFLGPNEFSGLVNLHLAFNSLSFWVNGQKGDGTLGGGIDVIQNMTYFEGGLMHSNGFSGPLPNFLGLKGLESMSLRDNAFTGVVPMSLVNLGSSKVVNLTNNLLQGPMPKFNSSVVVDMVKETNSFCLPTPGECDPRMNTFLSVVKSMDYLAAL